MYIAKNIFLGIVDVPEANVENSFTINVGSNINLSQNVFNVTSDKNIVYNVTNTKNISITSNYNYDLNVNNNDIYILII